MADAEVAKSLFPATPLRSGSACSRCGTDPLYPVGWWRPLPIRFLPAGAGAIARIDPASSEGLAACCAVPSLVMVGAPQCAVIADGASSFGEVCI
jgi:hypothetical protein